MNMPQLPFPVLIVFVTLFFSFLIPILGWWKKRLCYPLALMAVSISLFSSFVVANRVLKHGPIHYYLGGWEPPWGIEFYIDHLNALMVVLVTSISFLVVISSKKSIEKEIPQKEVPFYSLFLLLLTGLSGIVLTGDMFNLYVFLEIASLSAYALISAGEEGATYAAFRYVVLGTIGACFYLLGVGYLYIVTGSLNMADLSQLLSHLYGSKVVLVAFAFFMVGIAIKMALFPLHVWLPDAYTYAPSAVSSFIAPLMTKVGIYVMIKVMFKVFAPSFSIEMLPVTTILGWISATAIIVGCVLALAQTDLKRMLTYIMVAEVGYIALGVGLANRNALTGAILHIVNDAVMMSCLFLFITAIMFKSGIRNIYELRSLHRKMPFTMGAFTIAALSMMGIPPACGFFSKWYLMLGAIDAENWVFAAVILMSGLFNAILFFRVIENTYFEPAYALDGGEHREVVRDEAPLSMLIPLLLMAAGIILLGIFSGKIISSVIQFALPAGF